MSFALVSLVGASAQEVVQLVTGAQLGTALGVAALLLLAATFAEPSTGTVVAWAAIAGSPVSPSWPC